MNTEMKAKALVLPDGVEMEGDICGDVTREFIEMRTKIQDKAIRQWLISQGWTPPREGNDECFEDG